MQSRKLFLPAIPAVCFQKRNFIRRFIESYDDDSYKGIRLFYELIDLNLSNNRELAYAFVLALEMRKYRIAACLFGKANGSNPSGVPFLFLNYDSDLERCLNILQACGFYAKQNLQLLDELLDHADTLDKYPKISRLLLYTTYKKLLDLRNFIPKWKIIEKRFLNRFVSLRINDCFRCLLDDFLCGTANRRDVKHLLAVNIPGINVIDVLELTVELESNFSSCLLFGDDFYLPDELLNESISLLQYVILIPAIPNRSNILTLDLFKAFISQDRRCLFQRDSKGNDVFYYLEKLRPQMAADKYNEIYHFMQNTYQLHLHQAITFFGGSKKYDEGASSVISQLPHELVRGMVSLMSAV